MADDYKAIINSINAKADKLIIKYQQLKNENNKLIEEKDYLLLKLKESENRLEELKSKYENLRSGKVIDLTKDDVKLTKTKINRLVREIDACIALLNVN